MDEEIQLLQPKRFNIYFIIKVQQIKLYTRSMQGIQLHTGPMQLVKTQSYNSQNKTE